MSLGYGGKCIKTYRDFGKHNFDHLYSILKHCKFDFDDNRIARRLIYEIESSYIKDGRVPEEIVINL